MNVFIIPSWYPSKQHPTAGIFFRDQAVIYAENQAASRIGISTWGSHDERLWLSSRQIIRSIGNLMLPKPKSESKSLTANCKLYFTPARTWTRRIYRGNIDGIIEANLRNLEKFQAEYGKVHIIHAHCAYPAGYVAMHLSELLGIPFVITEHMSPFPMRSFAADFKSYIVPPLKQANLVFAVSEALRSSIQNLGIRVKRSSNFIDDHFFIPRDSEKISNDKFKVLFVGRLGMQKNPMRLFDIFSKPNSIPDYHLTIVGDGDLKSTMMNTISKQNFDVEFKGWLDKEGLRTQYHQADVLLLPSIHENQPVVILEAKACGLPIVTSSWDGVDEIVQDHDVVFPQGDVDQMLQGLERVRNRTLNKSQIRHLFESRWSSKKLVTDLNDAYHAVIKG
jgi:glycosyltransferase involved in cell wall biosynthesis